MSKPRQPALFTDPDEDTRGGPVYQGVCAQIRALFPKDDAEAQARKERLKGTIAQARSVASSLDRVSGHAPGTRQAAGMQLAALHHQLDELLERLAPDDGPDPFDVFLGSLTATPAQEGSPGGSAEIPYRP